MSAGSEYFPVLTGSVSTDRAVLERLSGAATSSDFSAQTPSSAAETVASVSLGHSKYSLRTRSLQKRQQTESRQRQHQRQQEQDHQQHTDTDAADGNAGSRKRCKARPAPLSKYRRKTANAKERSRMRDINVAFEMLERCVPQLAARAAAGYHHHGHEKVTKITILRLAITYIRTLTSLLDQTPQPSASPATTTMAVHSYPSLTAPPAAPSTSAAVPMLSSVAVSCCDAGYCSECAPSPTASSSSSMSMMSCTSSSSPSLDFLPDALDEIGDLIDFQLPPDLVVLLDGAAQTSTSSHTMHNSSLELGPRLNHS